MKRRAWVSALTIVAGLPLRLALATGQPDVASGVWDVGHECVRPGCVPQPLKVVVSRAPDLGDELSVTATDEQGRSRQVFRRAEGDRFLGMYPTRDTGGQLITIWMGGSAYRLSVLSEKDGHVAEVLEAGSESMPESVYCANGQPVFLVTRWNWKVIGSQKQKLPADVAIFRWQGGAYTQVETSPWGDRLDRATARCPSSN